MDARPDPSQAATPPTAPTAKRRRWPWIVGLVLLLVLAVPVVLVAAAWQALHTESGTRWWLGQAAQRVPGLTLSQPQGALIGSGADFSLGRLALQAGGTRVQVEQLHIRHLQVTQWQLKAPYVHVAADLLGAQRIEVATTPSTEPSKPMQPLNDLRLPVSAHVERVDVAQLLLPGLAVPVEALHARLDAGAVHRIDGLSARWNGLQADGAVQIGADAPLPLQAQLQVRGSDAAQPPADPAASAATTAPPASTSPSVLPPWARALQLSLQASGPLSRFDAQTALALQDQHIDVKAQVTPFDPLPVSQLEARVTELDIAKLLAPMAAMAPAGQPPMPLPSTGLTGTVLLQLNRDQPLAARAQLSNSAPGRWDQLRLPLRNIDVVARGNGSAWTIERALVQLASDAKTPAGTVSASGQFDGAAGDAQITLDKILLAGLDVRAPPLQLSGPITIKHTPDAAAQQAASAPPSTAASAANTPAPAAFGRLDFKAELAGLLTGAERSKVAKPLQRTVQLTARGNATPTAATLDALSLRAGDARLDGKASARREGAQWDAAADLKLAGFDPSQWLPSASNGGWRRGRNALNGQAALKARIPAEAKDTAALLAALRGSLTLDLNDSALAGQPLSLKLQADADGAGLLDANASASAAGNDLQATLKLRVPTGKPPPADETLQLKLNAPALSRLAPLAEAFGAGQLAGSAHVDATADGALGSWLLGQTADAAASNTSKTSNAKAGKGTAAPAGPLRTRGSLKAEALQAGPVTLGSADGDWSATLPGNQPAAAALAQAALQARVAIAQLKLPGLLVPDANLDATGTLADHRAAVRATLRQPPPPGSAASEAAPLAVAVDLNGAWQAGDGNAPNVWRVRVPELSVRPVATSATAAKPVAAAAPSAAASGAAKAAAAAPLPLVVARDLRFELQQGPQLLRAAADPGQADVLGAVLRWTALRWQHQGDSAPQIELQAEVQPVRVADLLQRLQPDFGWAGDLRVGAKVSVRSDPAVTARVEIARTGGDLQIAEYGGTRALGLSELRIVATADNGVWRFSQQLGGSDLGRISGEQTVRTQPELLWPAPDAPIDGKLNAQIENLAGWGAWVPAGWRLGGQIDAALALAGRFGAPSLTGQINGRNLAVRNALEGVVLTDGTLDARFEGETARLQALRFKAGDGSLQLSGDARLGAEPQAQLQLDIDHAAVLSRVDRRVVASGQATMKLDPGNIVVDGNIKADEGFIDISRGDAPALGDDVTVRRAGMPSPEDEAKAAAAVPERAPRAVSLKLAVDLGENFGVRGKGIDTRLQGQLRITSANGKLLANGEIRTDRGTYAAYAQKLDIERGVITFVGDIANPRLDIQAVRSGSDQRVGVIVGGSAQFPRVRLFSDPELPDADKLALLVTGKTYDSLSGSQSLLLQRAAMALFAGDGSSGESSFDVARMLQLDELSVRQSDGAVKDTVVTLGKQVSERVYVGYERGLATAAGNFQLIYKIAQRFTLRAQSGTDPAVDLIWMFKWN